jgi:Fe2+ or Zn2+ uptake regulation protein
MERKLMKDHGRDEFAHEAAAASYACPKHPDAGKLLTHGHIICKECGHMVEDRTIARRELMDSIVSKTY